VSCLTEFQYAVYADGELPEEEAREVTRHIASCGECRRLTASLRFERTSLVQSLQDIDLIEFELEDEALSAPPVRSLGAVRFGAFVLAMSVLLRPVFSALSEFQLPLSASALFDLFVDGVMYGIPSAVGFMSAFLNIASWVVVSCIACTALFLLFRKSPVVSTLVSVLTLLTVFSPWTYAIDVRRGEKPVNVPAGETLDDTLVVTGESSVDVDGTINGDLIVLARDVRVKGTVRGNVISFAERTEIDGNVEGSVLGTGGFVGVRGRIAQNLYGMAGSILIAEGAQINGNAGMLVGEATLDGAVGKDFNAYSARATRWGRARFGHSLFSSSGALQVLRHASIGRNLALKVDEPELATIESGANIGGRTNVDVTPAPRSPYVTASFYVWQTIWLAAAFLSGLTLLWAVPALGRVRLETGRDLLVAAGTGLAAAVVPPVAAVIAGLTLIGLPLGFLTIGFWIAALYLAKIVIAAFLGRSLAGGNHVTRSTPVMLLAGLLPVFVAVNLPYVGSIVNSVLVLLGLGVLTTTVYRLAQHKNASGSVPALIA
jgi:cytoskeletal protein CcmA (bactofilin family)